ncbi:hypothetical protein LX36DRAFT_486056 [Colletotrichum falcatum]|nr:hypothetical protein LX36DRAFT_486056 [Colletotrichum falcatum]
MHLPGCYLRSRYVCMVAMNGAMVGRHSSSRRRQVTVTHLRLPIARLFDQLFTITSAQLPFHRFPSPSSPSPSSSPKAHRLINQDGQFHPFSLNSSRLLHPIINVSFRCQAAPGFCFNHADIQRLALDLPAFSSPPHSVVRRRRRTCSLIGKGNFASLSTSHSSQKKSHHCDNRPGLSIESSPSRSQTSRQRKRPSFAPLCLQASRISRE